jgi:uncharacterized membrane protein (UPF0127 family)
MMAESKATKQRSDEGTMGNSLGPPARFVAYAFCLLLLCGCAKVATPTHSLTTATMKIGHETFTLEIANRDEERYRGLMYRDSMPRDHGMIFVFPDTAPRSFWMKDTRIPLDILYLDTNGVVVSIHQMKPYDLSGVHSDKPAKYAIELNQGAADRAGVKVGDRLDIPEAAREGT